ncbi:MAG: hypothetical protein HYV07_33320 [Deltaproteobacteria bacterium]|nr:hypothetical protein [Deltaproteobacteria bacterium]
MSQLTIPAGVSFQAFTHSLNVERGTAFEPAELAATLGFEGDLAARLQAPTSISALGLQRFTELERTKNLRSPNSVFSLFAGSLAGQTAVIRGPKSGYTISESARARVETGEITPEQARSAGTRAGQAVSRQVQESLDSALGDGKLTRHELVGGPFARGLRFMGMKVGGSILSAMSSDSLLQLGKLDPNDARVLRELLRRSDLPPGDEERITLEPGVRAELEKAVGAFQDALIRGSKTGAFVEKVGDEYTVNQTAMTWAKVPTDQLFDRLPPERWAEECFDLRSLHTRVLDRTSSPDGGYAVTLLQRMEFGSAPVATDMTKLTVVEKSRDENGRWCATVRWKVFASEPTAQIPRAGSMRIDEGRMEFRAVEAHGKAYTEIVFNNRTQTNTELERKIFDHILDKGTSARGQISAQLAAAEIKGIQDFARGVVERYRDVGTGKLEARWPSLSAWTVEELA